MKYILARGNIKQPLVGLFMENRVGRIICNKKTFVFEPGKVVDTGNYDLSSWVDMGIAKEVKEPQPESSLIDHEKLTDLLVNKSSKNIDEEKTSDGEHGEEYSVDTDVEEFNPIEDIDDSTVDKVPEENVDESNDDYVKMDDGSFKCLYCGKIYKGESWINRHIAKRHRDNEDAI
jgi:hypothetical protein